jgi:hypothetical protein
LEGLEWKLRDEATQQFIIDFTPRSTFLRALKMRGVKIV